ncbi:NYN domain-containing protein [Actinomyces slackii]|nr:NYN domain-containing protein [Actinomyces slackii]
MAVVIDYQNVHLTGASLFLPGRPYEEGLIDPYRFACQLALARNAKVDDAGRHASVERVEVFRGLPIPEDDPDAYRRNQAQKSQWERGHHGVVDVTLRPLKYTWEYRDGVKTPVRSSRREKGVDVLCALALVDLARSGHYDVVVLASRDTDLAPALDAAARIGRSKVEAAKWFDPASSWTMGRIRTEKRIRGASCQGAREIFSVPHVGMPAKRVGCREAFLTRMLWWTSGRALGIWAA